MPKIIQCYRHKIVFFMNKRIQKELHLVYLCMLYSVSLKNLRKLDTKGTSAADGQYLEMSSRNREKDLTQDPRDASGTSVDPSTVH